MQTHLGASLPPTMISIHSPHPSTRSGKNYCHLQEGNLKLCFVKREGQRTLAFAVSQLLQLKIINLPKWHSWHSLSIDHILVFLLPCGYGSGIPEVSGLSSQDCYICPVRNHALPAKKQPPHGAQGIPAPPACVSSNCASTLREQGLGEPWKAR